MAQFESRKVIGQARPKSDIESQIENIEKEIRETPYHKGTEHHIGKLRARISRLRDKVQESTSRKSGGGGGGYAVKKQGDATIILIGPPSAGKSTLINRLTNAQSKVAPYAFTTVSVIPGMMEYKNARIQILDVPGLIEGAEEGKGRGKEVLSVARGADLIVILSDIKRPEAIERIKKTLERNGIRLDIVRPNVIIDKKLSGGIMIHSNIKQDLSKETVKSVIEELGVKNADVTINEKLTLERLIDVFSKNRVYVPSISVINKVDHENMHKIQYNPTDKSEPEAVIHHQYTRISSQTGYGIDPLIEKIWETLEFVNVFLIKPEDQPNFDHPFVMKIGNTLKEVAEKIGTEFAEDKNKAKIWGNGAKFPGQEVSLTTPIRDGMQIRFL